MPRGIVDFHTHFYSTLYLTALEGAESTEVWRRAHDNRLICRWRGGVTLTVPQPHPGVNERLEMMDKLGIATQVLSIPAPSVDFLSPPEAANLSRQLNEGLANICRDHPSRFGALAAIPMRDTDLALTALEDGIQELRLDGIMVLTNIAGMPLDDDRLEPIWQAANDWRLLVYVHPTIPNDQNVDDYGLAMAVGFLGETTLGVSRLAYSGLFQRFPDIRWVFSHLGGTLPFILPRIDNYYRRHPEMKEVLHRAPSEYIREQIFDTASTHPPAIECAVQSLGAERLIFGSDYPHIEAGVAPFVDALRTIDAHDLGHSKWSDAVLSRGEILLAGDDI